MWKVFVYVELFLMKQVFFYQDVSVQVIIKVKALK